MPQSFSLRVAWVLWIALAAILAPQPVGADDKDEARSFVQSIAATVYALAWPTATYESFSLKSIDSVQGGYDVRVRLSGISAFSGDDLWMETVFKFRNGTLSDMKVARHNAVLAPPFSTSEAVGELLAELAEEAFGSQEPAHLSGPSSTGTSGYPFFFTNNCRHPIRLAIHYKGIDGVWRSESWWNFKGKQSSYLASNGERILTNNSIFYYYAEAQDGSFYWGGGEHEMNVSGRGLPMIMSKDDEGTSELSLSCPGW